MSGDGNEGDVTPATFRETCKKERSVEEEAGRAEEGEPGRVTIRRIGYHRSDIPNSVNRSPRKWAWLQKQSKQGE